MNDAFIQALADLAEEEASDARLIELRNQAMAKVAEGGGQLAFIIQAGQNGKTGQQECKMDAAALLGAVNRALQLYRGTAVSLTYTDFSQLQ